MAKNKSSLSQAENYQEIGNFWDEQDFTEYDDLERPDVHFEIQDTVRIEARLLTALEKAAAEHGVSTETLVNLWLLEKVQSTTSPLL